MSNRRNQAVDDRLNTWSDQAGRHPWWFALKAALGVTAIVLIVVAVIGIATTGSVFFEAQVAKRTAGARVTTKMYDPENIIGQVAFFTQTCEDVGKDYANWKTNEASYQREIQIVHVSTDAGQLADAQNQAQQFSTYVAGALEQLQADAANYDARSINYTANPFKGAGLPYRITPPADPSSLSQWSPPTCG